MGYRVFFTAPTPPAWREVILAEQPDGFEAIWRESDDPAELHAALAIADFMVSSTFDAEMIARATRVRMIQSPGVGYDRMDVAAANARGIPVAITPEATSVGVSEHTVMLILALYKHLRDADMALREGRWIRSELRPICLMLQGKRVGIVGVGRIGREVAKRLHALGVELVYHDIHPLSAEDEAALHLAYLPLDKLLSTSDVVTLHVFLTERSRKMIGARELALMKPSAVLINTCRGEVVDQPALYDALVSGRIAAAGLDVFEEEPVPADDPILTLDNVLLTPHMATNNRDAMIAKARACYANFQRVLRGEQPINLIRPYEEIISGNGAR
jgi:phosphoglycerate dehydrogenase-like enzyme